MNPWPFGDLQMFGYRTILADPAWSFANWSPAGEAKNPSQHYECMGIDAIKALPVGDLAIAPAALFLWATAPMLPQAIDVMKAWGFRYVTSGVWAKRSSRDRSWQFGPGYVLRSAAEFFLVGRIGSPEWRSKSVRNLIVEPVREHSRKPDGIYDVIERLCPGPYVELNARQRRDGWDSWGNEVDKFDAAIKPVLIE